MDGNQLKILKFNLKIFKIKNLINKLEFNDDFKNNINDYLFQVNENGDYTLNEELCRYNFEKYEVLEILESFLENLSDENFNLFKEKFNVELKKSFDKIELKDNLEFGLFEDLSDFEVKVVECSENTINSIISKIEIKNFNQISENTNLFIEFKEFKESPIFKFISNDFTNYEISKLMERIESDISAGKINGEIIDIVEFYTNEYTFIKKQFSLNNFLNSFIQSHSFEILVKKYEYDDSTILMILDKLRLDVLNDKISDENNLMFKLKDYLKKESIRQDYYKILLELKTKMPEIAKSFNLTHDEVLSIFNEIEAEINDYCVSDSSFKKYCESKLYRKVELNQSDSRIMLNKIIKSEKIQDALLNEDEQEKINNEIGDLIYKNKIRSNQITEKLILKKIDEVRSL